MVFLMIETMLTALERKILNAVQHGIPLSRSPYQDLSKAVGIGEEQLLDILKQWKAEGKIRRLGAIVNHFEIGHGVGAMVVWNIPEEKIDSIGQILARFSKVSHAYQRPRKENWPYSFYTMIHACNAEELKAAIDTLSRESGITEFRVLKTVRELKKVPPTYIIEK